MAESTPEDDWRRNVEAEANQWGLTVSTHGPGGEAVQGEVWLVKVDDDRASEDSHDRFGPYSFMGDEIVAAIQKVSGPLWRDRHPDPSGD